MYYDIMLYKLAQQQQMNEEALKRALGRRFIQTLALSERLAEQTLPRFGVAVGSGVLGGALGGAATALLRKGPVGRTMGKGALIGGVLGAGLGIYDWLRRRKIQRALARNMLMNYMYQYRL